MTVVSASVALVALLFVIHRDVQCVVIETSTCGTSKGCWSSSAGCTQSSCQYLVTYTVDPSGNYMIFEVSGQLASSTNSYFAMALSTSGMMGQFYAVLCYNLNGVNTVANGNIYPNGGFAFGTNNLVNASVSSSGGIMSCTFTRSRQSTGYSDNLTQLNSPFFILAATGTMTAGSPPTVNGHSSQWASSSFNLAQYPSQANASTTTTYSTTSPSSLPISTSSCGVTSGCWLSSSGCNQLTCSYLLTWTPNVAGNNVMFQLSAMVPAGSSTPYVAMAFSNDMQMGNDYTIGCWYDGSSVLVQDGYTFTMPTRGQSFLTPNDVGVNASGGWYYPGYNVLSCTFVRSLTPAGNTQAKNLVSGNSYYLFLAIGPQTDVGYGFGLHSSYFISSSQVDVTVVSTLGASNVKAMIVKAHAALMIIAWMLAFPVGSTVGRHYRVTLALKSSVGDKIWFQLHRSLQIIGTIVSAAGFVVIFVGVDGYSYFDVAPDSAHPIIGIIIMALCIINFCVGLAHPSRAARKLTRGKLFRWFHMLFGHCSLLLSCANVLVALLMVTMALPLWLIVFPIVFMFVHLLVNFILQHHQSRNKQKKHKETEQPESEVNQVYETNFSEINPQSTAQSPNAGFPTKPSQQSSKPERKRVSMLNNSFRKNVLYVYSAVLTAVTVAFVLVLCILF